MVRNATRMETTFYEDNLHQRFCGENVKNLKRTLTLDLNANSGQPVKRLKLNTVATPAPMLSSPDYKKLLINTPELEEMIKSQHGLPTPTPSALFPKPITEEQAEFTRGFEVALHAFQNNDSSQGELHHVELPRSSSSSSSSGATYMTLDSQYPSNQFGLGLSNEGVTVKEEPQTVPLGPTPPLSPIDMESQERFKLERKRERNRVAASKCRRRKLERIARLEDKVRQLKTENTELSSVVAKLKEHVCSLKEQVMEHVQSGCQIQVLTSAHFATC